MRWKRARRSDNVVDARGRSGMRLGGLGLGGMAVALASKDTLANLFGSIVVLVDRPFMVGDWVEIGSHEGTVEEVGLRVSRIRTFANSLITIPNSQLTTTAINMKQRNRSFIRFSPVIRMSRP